MVTQKECSVPSLVQTAQVVLERKILIVIIFLLLSPLTRIISVFCYYYLLLKWTLSLIHLKKYESLSPKFG